MTHALVLENVTARALGGDLIGASLVHESGVLAILGSAADGAGTLLAVAAGAARPSRGSVKSLGGSPPTASPRIAIVPLAQTLPEALRVRELVDLAATLRGDAPARTMDRLRAFGLEGLSERDTRTLSPVEARSVLACEALTSERTELVLLEEPLSKVLPSAAASMPRAIRDAKASVVFATASPEDARALGARVAILRKGRVIATLASLELWAVLRDQGARVIADVSDAHALAAAIVDRTIRLRIEPNRLTLEGSDPELLSRELQRAIVASDTQVEGVRLEPLGLEPLQAVATAHATALYEIALARARAAMPMPAPLEKP